MASEAGWLADPSGRSELRYFDGAKWTEHVTKGGEQGTDAAGAAIANTPAAKAPAAAKGGSLPLGALLVVKSHDEGRNATVTLYPDRIERVKDRAIGSLSRAKQDAEVIPMRSVSSVQAKKKGMRTDVTVYASGNTIDFRLGHDDAHRFKQAITDLLLTPAAASNAAPAAGQSVAAQIKELAALRDEGILSEDEFQAQKAKLLN